MSLVQPYTIASKCGIGIRNSAITYYFGLQNGSGGWSPAERTRLMRLYFWYRVGVSQSLPAAVRVRVFKNGTSTVLFTAAALLNATGWNDVEATGDELITPSDYLIIRAESSNNGAVLDAGFILEGRAA